MWRSLHGKPSTIGNFSITVRVVASDGGYDEQDYTITVNTAEEVHSKPSITTKTLATAYVDRNYQTQLEASGTQPITWRIISGALPTDIALSSSGLINRKAINAASYSFTVEASNSAGSAQKTLYLTVKDSASSTYTPYFPEDDDDEIDGVDGNNRSGENKSGGSCNFSMWGLISLTIVIGFFLDIREKRI